MDNIHFSEDELKYIYTDITDKSQDIHLEGTQTVKAKLPNGKYYIKINTFENRETLCEYLKERHNINTFTHLQGIGFTINNNNEIQINFVNENISNIVLQFRQQAAINCRKSTQEYESLIKKDIKRRKTYLAIDHKNNYTDLGIAFNGRSLHNTVQECLDNDIDIEIDESKPISDLYVRYLRAMKLKQDMERLDAKQKALDEERLDIERRQNELFKR